MIISWYEPIRIHVRRLVVLRGLNEQFNACYHVYTFSTYCRLIIFCLYWYWSWKPTSHNFNVFIINFLYNLWLNQVERVGCWECWFFVLDKCILLLYATNIYYILLSFPVRSNFVTKSGIDMQFSVSESWKRKSLLWNLI